MVLFLEVGGDYIGLYFILPSRSLSNASVPSPEQMPEKDRYLAIWNTNLSFTNKGDKGRGHMSGFPRAFLEMLLLVCLEHPLMFIFSTHLQHLPLLRLSF